MWRYWLSYVVWGLITYGLTRVIVDVAARFGVHITGMCESLVYGLMVVPAAWLLLQVYDGPSGRRR
jgi:hypothetical protein